MPSNNFTQVKIRKTTLKVLKGQAQAEGRSMSNLLDRLIIGESVSHTPEELVDKYSEVGTQLARGLEEEMAAAALSPQSKPKQAEATDASGFGAKEPCQGHQLRWDCGRPLCKYGAGK